MSDLKCFICVSFNGPFWGYFVPCGLFDPSVKANMSLKAKIVNNGLLVISYFISSANISWPIRIEKESQLKKGKIYVKISHLKSHGQVLLVKFKYSEKATKLCKISTVDLSYVVPVKSLVEISKKSVAFSEYMNSIICLLDTHTSWH